MHEGWPALRPVPASLAGRTDQPQNGQRRVRHAGHGQRRDTGTRHACARSQSARLTGCSSLADCRPVLSCAARSVADGGRRPTILGLDLDFDLGFGFCPAGLAGRALLLFLTSPPRMFLDGGVRSGTPWSSAPCASGQASRAPACSAGGTVPARTVGSVCGACRCTGLRVCRPFLASPHYLSGGRGIASTRPETNNGLGLRWDYEIWQLIELMSLNQ